MWVRSKCAVCLVPVLCTQQQKRSRWLICEECWRVLVQMGWKPIRGERYLICLIAPEFYDNNGQNGSLEP